MASRRSCPIVLTDVQRDVLEGVVRRTHCPQAIALRARVVLAAGAGLGDVRIATDLGCSRELSRRWRGRFAVAQREWSAGGGDWDRDTWAGKVVGLLEDRERSGAPATFTAEQLCQIVAIACERRPEECGRPVTHWTARELADEAVRRGVVPRISPRHVGRFLKGGGPPAPRGAAVAE